MAFVKLTDLNGQPLLLKCELIESVRPNVIRTYYSGNKLYSTESNGTTIKLTNDNKYIVEESVEEVEKVLGGTNDI